MRIYPIIRAIVVPKLRKRLLKVKTLIANNTAPITPSSLGKDKSIYEAFPLLFQIDLLLNNLNPYCLYCLQTLPLLPSLSKF
ncbi:MAG: hypothetical protein C0174_03265 [Thermodesulfobium narugense]|nr:MAG: hypothetical protein C0174_03265 [Thermodesulfobium narugense]